MWTLALLACSDTRFAQVLEARTPADLSPYAVTLREPWSEGVGWGGHDPSLPELVVERPYAVSGYELRFTEAGQVDALLAAWGTPHALGRYVATREIDPATLEERWIEGPVATSTWWSVDRSQVVTLWRPDPAGPATLTVRPFLEPRAALTHLVRCDLWGLGGEYAPPSVTPVDLSPARNNQVAGDGVMWRLRDDGSFADEVSAGLDAASVRVEGRRAWACPDPSKQIALLASGDGVVDILVGRPHVAASVQGLTPAEQLVALARQRAQTLGCVAVQPGMVELVFSVHAGQVTEVAVYEATLSGNNAPAQRRPATDMAARCIEERARTWTFPGELSGEDLSLSFAVR